MWTAKETTGPAAPDRAPPAPEATHGEESETERAVRCARCGHVLARAKDAIEVNGAHVHAFSNPAGVEFRIGCFARADGCMPIGAEETFFTWFPGHAWRIALCAACAAHVGWSFTRNGGAFFGLVLARLA